MEWLKKLGLVHCPTREDLLGQVEKFAKKFMEDYDPSDPLTSLGPKLKKDGVAVVHTYTLESEICYKVSAHTQRERETRGGRE